MIPRYSLLVRAFLLVPFFLAVYSVSLYGESRSDRPVLLISVECDRSLVTPEWDDPESFIRRKLDDYGNNLAGQDGSLRGGQGARFFITPRRGETVQIRGELIHTESGTLLRSADITSPSPGRVYIEYAIDCCIRDVLGITRFSAESVAFTKGVLPAIPDFSLYPFVSIDELYSRLGEIVERAENGEPGHRHYSDLIESLEELAKRAGELQFTRRGIADNYSETDFQDALYSLVKHINGATRGVLDEFYSWELFDLGRTITGLGPRYRTIISTRRPGSREARLLRWEEVLDDLDKYNFTRELESDPRISDIYGREFGLPLQTDLEASRRGYLWISVICGRNNARAWPVVLTDGSSGRSIRKEVSGVPWEVIFRQSSDVVLAAGDSEMSLRISPGDRLDVTLQEDLLRVEEPVFSFPGVYGFYFDRGEARVSQTVHTKTWGGLILDVWGGPRLIGRALETPFVQAAPSLGVRLGADMILRDDPVSVSQLTRDNYLAGTASALIVGGSLFSAAYLSGNRAMALPLGVSASFLAFSSLVTSDMIGGEEGYLAPFIGAVFAGGLGAFSLYAAGEPLPWLNGGILGLYGGMTLGGIISALIDRDEISPVLIVGLGLLGAGGGGALGGLTEWKFVRGFSGSMISLLPVLGAGIAAGALGTGCSVDITARLSRLPLYGSFQPFPLGVITLNVLNLNWGLAGFPFTFSLSCNFENISGFYWENVEYTASDEYTSWNYYPSAALTLKAAGPLVLQGEISGFREGFGSRDLSVSGTAAFVTPVADLGYTLSFVSEKNSTGDEARKVFEQDDGTRLSWGRRETAHLFHLNIHPAEWITVYGKGGVRVPVIALFTVADGTIGSEVYHFSSPVPEAEMGVKISVAGLIKKAVSPKNR